MGPAVDGLRADCEGDALILDVGVEQQAWLKYDVAQCGYCQPGQIMAAVALVNEIKAEGRQIADADLDSLRNICRCGTYPRIREAIVEAAASM
jgi:isoquinoline 1-oxidoreductase alpha subunit